MPTNSSLCHSGRNTAVMEVAFLIKNDIRKGSLSNKTERNIKKLNPSIEMKEPLVVMPEPLTSQIINYSGVVQISIFHSEGIPYLSIVNDKKGNTHYYLRIYYNGKNVKVPLKDFNDVKRFREVFDINKWEEKIQDVEKEVAVSFELTPLNFVEDKKVQKIVEYLKQFAGKLRTKDTTYIVPNFKWKGIDGDIKSFDEFLNKAELLDCSFITYNIREIETDDKSVHIVFRHIISDNQKSIEVVNNEREMSR